MDVEAAHLAFFHGEIVVDEDGVVIAGGVSIIVVKGEAAAACGDRAAILRWTVLGPKPTRESWRNCAS